MLTRCFCLGLLVGILYADLALASESLVGKWNTIDEKNGKVTSEVELYEQAGKLFGKIISLPEPNDKEGKPKRCTPCTGDDKDQPVVGLVILKNLSPVGDRYKNGTLLDPDDGKIYKGEVWLDGGTLKVRGYIGVFFRTQTWVRAQ